jgi:predicted naringenin-chalcone synthase
MPRGTERVRKMFLNGDIDFRHFCLEGDFSRGESSDQLNQRYLRGAMKTGCRAITNCLELSRLTARDVDFLVVCTCTGYICPDLGSRFIAHMGIASGRTEGARRSTAVSGAHRNADAILAARLGELRKYVFSHRYVRFG